MGCCAPGQAALVENRPRTVDARSVLEWRTAGAYAATGAERNAERVSQRVDVSIRAFPLESAKLFYDRFAHEFYVIGPDGTALVQNIDSRRLVCLHELRRALPHQLQGRAVFRHRRRASCGIFPSSTPTTAARPSTRSGSPGAMGFDEDFKVKYSTMLWLGVKPEDGGASP